MKQCTTCQGFAWWDGDFCCVTNMKIILPSEDGRWTAKIPNEFNAEECEDYDYSPVVADLYDKQYMEFLENIKGETE